MTTAAAATGAGLGGLGLLPLGGGPRVAQRYGLQPMRPNAEPYIAHLYSIDLAFKRNLGGAVLLNRPGLKETQNGGGQQLVLELATPISDVIYRLVEGEACGLSVWTAVADPGAVGGSAAKLAVGGAAGAYIQDSAFAAGPAIPPGVYDMYARVRVTSKASAVLQLRIGLYDQVSAWIAGNYSDYAPSAFATAWGDPGAVVKCLSNWSPASGRIYSMVAQNNLGVAATDYFIDQMWLVQRGIGPGDVIRITEEGPTPYPGLSSSFEKADLADSTIPDGWVHKNIGAGTGALVASNSHSGVNAMSLTGSGAGDYGGIFNRQGIALPDAGFVNLSLWAKTAGGPLAGSLARITFCNPGGTISPSGVASNQPSLEPSAIYYDLNPTVAVAYGQFSNSVAIPFGYRYAFIEIYAHNMGANILYVDDLAVSIAPATEPNGAILWSGNVETTPEEESSASVKHAIVVAPWITELAGADFDRQYTTPTAAAPADPTRAFSLGPVDVAQFVRDAVAGTAHLSVTPVSCPNTGIKATYDFQNSNALDALHVAKQIAGANFWYGVDAQGVVWLQPVNLAGPPTLTFKKGTDYSTKKPLATITGLKNVIPAMGGQALGDTARLRSRYNNPTSRRLYGTRAFNPTLSYPTVTDQATLDAITASLGAQYDRIQHTMEVDLPSFGRRLTPYRPGGLTARFWEPDRESRVESATGTAAGYSPTFMLQDVEVLTPNQHAIFGDVPYADLDTVYEAMRIAQRMSTIAATAIPAPVLVPSTAPPPPPPVAQTNVDYSANAAAGIYPMGGGTVVVATVSFTTLKAGVVQLIASIDARMEAWDDYTSVRFVWADIAGIVTNAQQKLPFGLARATYNPSSAPGIAMPAGAYTARLLIQTAGYNQMHVYSGYVTAHWTG